MEQKTMKENYEAINKILRENNQNLSKIEDAIQNIKYAYNIVIPILEAFHQPIVDHDYDAIEEYNINMGYKLTLKREIRLEARGILSEGNEKEVQKLLDKYSPIKIRVNKISAASSTSMQKYVKIAVELV